MQRPYKGPKEQGLLEGLLIGETMSDEEPQAMQKHYLNVG